MWQPRSSSFICLHWTRRFSMTHRQHGGYPKNGVVGSQSSSEWIVGHSSLIGLWKGCPSSRHSSNRDDHCVYSTANNRSKEGKCRLPAATFWRNLWPSGLLPLFPLLTLPPC